MRESTLPCIKKTSFIIKESLGRDLLHPALRDRFSLSTRVWARSHFIMYLKQLRDIGACHKEVAKIIIICLYHYP